MTIILFLIDTSASMNQRTYLGTSMLDLAKGAVELFLKIRSRDQASRGMDRYMLLTFEDPPSNVKAGWKESQAVFHQELKNLKAFGLTNFGEALGNAFHLLNINRLQSGIDNYGQGRYPFWLEPAMIITITDGDSLITTDGVDKELKVPVVPATGSELTGEPFRWDQRVFSLLLQLPGHPPKETHVPGAMVPSDPTNPVDRMCEVTGGRSYAVSSHKVLNQCIESLVQKAQSGVVINLEKFGPDPPPVVETIPDGILVNGEDGIENHRNGIGNDVKPILKKTNPFISNGYLHDNTTEKKSILHGSNNFKVKEGNVAEDLRAADDKAPPIIRLDSSGSEESNQTVTGPGPWILTKKMIFVPRFFGKGYVGHWPIPESFWPDFSSSTLPSRSAHPTISFKCDSCEPLVFPDFPFDKYELEPSPLTLFILARKQPLYCWQVFVQNSGRHEGLGLPFGYIKASSDLRCVNLFVMPYNYPVLIPLIEELKLQLKGKLSQKWKMAFERYLKTVPPYYFGALRKALARMNLQHVMPDQSLDMVMSFSVQSYIAKAKHSAKIAFEALCASVSQPAIITEGVPLIPRSKISLASSEFLMADNLTADRVAAMKTELTEFKDFRLFFKHSGTTIDGFTNPTSAPFKNPFDIRRDQLLEQIAKMRLNLKHQLSRSTIPVLDGGLPGSKLKLQQAEEMHNLPIGQMGNYQDYLNKMPPALREIEAAPVRAHAFGNPFKIDKKMLVDEADIDILGSANVPNKVTGKNRKSGEEGEMNKVGRGMRPKKKKPGPLPRNYRWKRKRAKERDSGMGDDDLSSVVSSGSDLGSVTSDFSDVDSMEGSYVCEASTSAESIEEAIAKLHSDFPDLNDPDSEPDRTKSPREPSQLQEPSIRDGTQPSTSEGSLPSLPQARVKLKRQLPDAETHAAPPVKKVKAGDETARLPPAKRLDSAVLRRMKNDLNQRIRKVGPDRLKEPGLTAIFTKPPSLLDRILLIEHSLREASRFKKKSLIAWLGGHLKNSKSQLRPSE